VRDFAAHAKGRKQLRLEYFYRKLRHKTGSASWGRFKIRRRLCKASSVQYAHSPHAAWLDQLVHPKLMMTELPKPFTDVDTYCKSFSAWWNKAKTRPLAEFEI
jgi:hypothetical protein